MGLRLAFAMTLVLLSACVGREIPTLRDVTFQTITPETPLPPAALNITAVPSPTPDSCGAQFVATLSASATRVPVGSRVNLFVSSNSGLNSFLVVARDDDSTETQILGLGTEMVRRNTDAKSKYFYFVSGDGRDGLKASLIALQPGKTTFFVDVNGEFLHRERKSDNTCYLYFNYERIKTNEITLEAVAK